MSQDGRIAYARIQFGDVQQLAPKLVSQVEDRVEQARGDGLQVELSASAFAAPEKIDSELIGLIAAVIILLVAFGSVLAMGLPIGTALFGVGVGLASVNLLSNLVTMPSFVVELATMIGIGVGIDYALFIVTRYRQGLSEGKDPTDAVAEAVSTSGKAVVFAGCTVIISLLGMFAMGISFVNGMALGAAAAVLVTMLCSLTLLPAVLGFVGHTIDRLRCRGGPMPATPTCVASGTGGAAPSSADPGPSPPSASPSWSPWPGRCSPSASAPPTPARCPPPTPPTAPSS